MEGDNEFDSRVLKTSTGFGGITKPKIFEDGEHQRVYCSNCGEPHGWATTKEGGLTGIIAICDKCHEALGNLPIPLLGHRPDDY